MSAAKMYNHAAYMRAYRKANVWKLLAYSERASELKRARRAGLSLDRLRPGRRGTDCATAVVVLFREVGEVARPDCWETLCAFRYWWRKKHGDVRYIDTLSEEEHAPHHGS